MKGTRSFYLYDLERFIEMCYIHTAAILRSPPYNRNIVQSIRGLKYSDASHIFPFLIIFKLR